APYRRHGLPGSELPFAGISPAGRTWHEGSRRDAQCLGLRASPVRHFEHSAIEISDEGPATTPPAFGTQSRPIGERAAAASPRAFTTQSPAAGPGYVAPF